MGREGHEGLHWAWTGDAYIEWPEGHSSEVLADGTRRDRSAAAAPRRPYALGGRLRPPTGPTGRQSQER